MTDYLEVLLLEQQEEETETMALSTVHPVPVEKKQVSDGIPGKREDRAEGGQEEPPVFSTFRLTGNGSVWQAAVVGEREQKLPSVSQKQDMDAPDQTRNQAAPAALLYRALRRTGQAVSRSSRTLERTVSLSREGGEQQRLTLAQLDRQMEVDARRYDGAFRLY